MEALLGETVPSNRDEFHHVLPGRQLSSGQVHRTHNGVCYKKLHCMCS